MDLRKQVAVSIIMPVYNSEKYLANCVNSILMQNFNSFELLLIDDGSSDGSSLMCDKFAEQDARVMVYHKENSGICSSRNFGLDRANGEYIAFSDHDDYIEQGFLNDNYDIAKSKNADIVKFGRKSLILRNEVVENMEIRSFPSRVLKSVDIKAEFLQLRFDGAMTCVWDGLFRREFLLENDLQFDLSYKKGGEDIDFCSKCFALAKTLCLNNKVYYDHYIRMGYSTSTKIDNRRLIKFQKLCDNMEYCIDYLNIDRELNSELYLLNIMREQVYPALIYFKSMHTPFLDVKKYLNKLHNEKVVYRTSKKNMWSYSRKWGIFTWLFISKQYRLMFFLLKLRKDN